MKRNEILRGALIIGVTAVAIFLLMVSTASAESNIIKYTPNMTVNALAGRPDTDFIEFSGGRRMSLGDIRRLEATQKKMMAAVPGSKLPAAFKSKPAATGIQINNAADLEAALKRPDNETVRLPSGRLVTVGLIKFMQERVEKRLGHKLTGLAQRPNLSGPAVKITNATTEADWKSIFQRPDSTVLESPNGERITVGELKQYMAEYTKTRQSLPRKTEPALAPKKR